MTLAEVEAAIGYPADKCYYDMLKAAIDLVAVRFQGVLAVNRYLIDEFGPGSQKLQMRDGDPKNSIYGWIDTDYSLVFDSQGRLKAFTYDAPIHVASKKGDLERVRALLRNDPSDAMRLDHKGATALHLAAFYGYKEIAELLLANNAAVNAKVGPMSPLQLAAQAGKYDVAQVLLAHNADVEATNSNGMTPLQEAAVMGHKDLVELLLANNAVISSRASDGFTALHWAAAKGSKDVAALLLAKGAEVDARDNRGMTPLHVAAISGKETVAELLLAKGADVNAKADDGTTPVAGAASKGHKDVVKLLQRHGGRRK
jgi:ankyrin repeat protein